MIRITLTVALVLCALADARSQDRPAQPRLKALVSVSGDLVRIGDLVDDAGAAAAVAVFRAPDLGQTGSVPTAQVLAALRTHELGDIDTDGLAEVVVTRLSRSIAARDIEDRIARALEGHRGFGPADNLKVALDREIRTLHVEATATGDLAVTRLQADPRSGRFDITLDIPGSASARRQPLRFTGAVSEVVETATLLRPLARGETIRASDVAMERRPKAEITGEALALDQVIGLSAKRALRPNQALRATDLAKPEVVQRNETVTIVYRVPGILLTVRGKALEAGSLGDHISVLNIQSNRTIQVVVAGPGQVVATSLPRAVAGMAPDVRVSSIQQ